MNRIVTVQPIVATSAMQTRVGDSIFQASKDENMNHLHTHLYSLVVLIVDINAIKRNLKSYRSIFFLMLSKLSWIVSCHREQ